MVAGIIYWLHGFDGYLSRDLSLYAYANQQVVDGVPPYLSVVNRSGPISHAFASPGVLAARLVGGDDLTGMRIWVLLLSAAFIAVVYLLARDTLRSRLGGIAAAAAMLTVDGFTQYASDGPREKTAMVLFLAIGLLALVRRHPFWAGFFVSLATLTWQPAFFAGVVAAGVAALAPSYGTWRARLKALGAVAAGGLLPLVLFLLWYAAMGELQQFLECFVLIHVSYTDQPGMTGVPWFSILTEAYGASLWVLFAGCAVLLGRGAWVVWRRAWRADPGLWSEVALAAGLLAGIAWSIVVFNGWPDIFFLLPMVVTGVGGIVRLVTLVPRVPRLVPIGITAAWFVVAVVMGLAFSLRPYDETLPEQRAEVRAVMSQLPEDATIVSIEAPQALVLTGKRDPFRHQMFGLGLSSYVDHAYPGGRTGLREDIAARHPEVITMGKYHRAWMDPLLDREYVRIPSGAGFTWYISRSVGKDVIDRLVSRSRHATD